MLILQWQRYGRGTSPKTSSWHNQFHISSESDKKVLGEGAIFLANFALLCIFLFLTLSLRSQNLVIGVSFFPIGKRVFFGNNKCMA